MMEQLKAAHDEIVTALKTLSPIKLRYSPFGANGLQPPAVVLGPPSVNLTTYAGEPTDADFGVFIVVAFDDRTVESLLGFIEPVTEALEAIPGVVVQTIQPTTYAPADLPCYLLTINAALS